MDDRAPSNTHRSHNLDSVAGGYMGAVIGVIEGDTGSLDYSPYDMSVGVITGGSECILWILPPLSNSWRIAACVCVCMYIYRCYSYIESKNLTYPYYGLLLGEGQCHMYPYHALEAFAEEATASSRGIDPEWNRAKH